MTPSYRVWYWYGGSEVGSWKPILENYPRVSWAMDDAVEMARTGYCAFVLPNDADDPVSPPSEWDFENLCYKNGFTCLSRLKENV